MARKIKTMSEPKPRKKLSPRNEYQRNVINTIYRNSVVFLLGPAGCGKTVLSVGCALQLLESQEIERIVLTRPAVELGRGLGFLPGDINEKMAPYIQPIFDSFKVFLNNQELATLINGKYIEICPLSVMRGRTFNSSLVIVDEAQSCTHAELKMCLTRMGEQSKMVINGDPTQSDLPISQRGALQDYSRWLDSVDGIESVYSNNEDIVRSSLIGKILEKIDKFEGISNTIPQYGKNISEK